MASASKGMGIMKKRNWTLQVLLAAAPLIPTTLVLQSIAVCWVKNPEPAQRWLLILPILGTLAAGVLGAAFGGPLLSDKIKKDAGILEKEM